MELPYSVIDPSINDFTEDAFSDFDEEVKQLNNDVQTIQVEGEFVDGRDETEELEFNNRSREHQMEMQSSSTSFTRQSHVRIVYCRQLHRIRCLGHCSSLRRQRFISRRGIKQGYR